MGSIPSWVAFWWVPTRDISLTIQVVGRVAFSLPYPSLSLPSSTHGQARQDLQSTRPAGCSKHQKQQKTPKIPSGGGLHPSQRVFAFRKGPTATSALPHLSPDMGVPSNRPPWCLLSHSSHLGNLRQREVWARNNCLYLCAGEIWDYLWKFRCC